MKSTSISRRKLKFHSRAEIGGNEVLLKVQNLNLIYQVPVRQQGSWRDMFTSFAQSPSSILFGETRLLHVINNLNFEVRRGERVGILGINGAGKTSLCRCLAGVFAPTSGIIECKASVRAIFDAQVGIQPELTGRENAELLAEFLFPDRSDTAAIIEEALEFSELREFINVPYKLYSNGMQARLYLSMIFALPADLFILDEVFDGADTFFKAKIAERIKTILDKSGATIFVSHSFDQIRKVCSRLILLHNAGIIYDGPTEPGFSVYENLRPMRA